MRLNNYEYSNSKSAIRHTTPEELMQIYPNITWTASPDFLLKYMCLDISKAEKPSVMRRGMLPGWGWWPRSSGVNGPGCFKVGERT